MNVLFVVGKLDYADHVAIAYLSAVAKLLGHKTHFCNLATDSLVLKVHEVRPVVVAYSANIATYRAIVNAHCKAHEVHPFWSILGGPQATFSPETFGESKMDAYCVGEGEEAFRDFLCRVEVGASFASVPNLITRAQANPVRPLIKVDSLPLPDRDLTIANSFLKNTSKKTFYASRGCAFSCKYCCNNHYHKLYRGNPVVRRFSVPSLLAEMGAVMGKYRMEFVKFGDDMFAIRADDWLEEFAEYYLHYICLPFNCYLRLDLADDPVLKLLKKAGCWSVHLSVDSVSRHVRETILGRRFKDIDLVDRLRLIKSYGIKTWVNFMLAAPESTVQDDLESIYVARKGDVTYPAYSTTVLMKGTDLYRYGTEHGLMGEGYTGNMDECWGRSTLKGFTEKEKDVRYNVFLLGAVAAKAPTPLHWLVLWLIKHTRPNRAYRFMRDRLYEFYITRRIFKL